MLYHHPLLMRILHLSASSPSSSEQRALLAGRTEMTLQHAHDNSQPKYCGDELIMYYVTCISRLDEISIGQQV